MQFVEIASEKPVNLQDLRDLVGKFSTATGTWLLPTDELSYLSVQDLIQSWTKINLNRSFAESGFSEAVMNLEMGNHRIRFSYLSTSSTSLIILINLDCDQEIDGIKFEVLLPTHRAHAGRIHYEYLTAKFGLPISGGPAATPEWVQKKEFEDYFVNNSVEFFQKRNFQQVSSPMGLVWKRDHVVVKRLDEPIPRFLVVWYDQYRDKNTEQYIEGYYSLDEFLKREPRKPNSWRKRRSQSSEDLETDAEYEELEESSLYEDENS